MLHILGFVPSSSAFLAQSTHSLYKFLKKGHQTEEAGLTGEVGQRSKDTIRGDQTLESITQFSPKSQTAIHSSSTEAVPVAKAAAAAAEETSSCIGNSSK